MLKIGITYNPYFVTTEITIDGEKIQESSKLFELCRRERLQNWVDKLLPALYNERREKRVEISFKGTDLDADDVRSAVKQYNALNPGHCFSLVDVESKHTGVHRVTALKELFEKGKTGPFAHTFNTTEMQVAFDRALDPTFEINVIATMSSGKSTVVNALLGKELMPAKNEACTATIARIEDDDDAPLFTAQRFDKHGNPLSDIKEANNALLTEWNDDESTSLIEIKGNIPTVQQTDECTMVFVDTPGPNNARDEDHQRITLEAIKSRPLSMILYVLNSTQLSTNDDRWLLDQVCSAMSAGGRQAQDRFIFVANKIDAFDPEKGESVTRALKNVRDYLQDKDERGNVQGIENPLIIPVSAQLAKLLRIKNNGGNLTRSERGDLAKFVDLFVLEKEMNMVEHIKSRLNADCVRRLKEKVDEANSNEKLAEILSGVPIIEELLNDFLQKHAMPAKLKDAVDSFERVMQEAKIAEKMNEQLAKNDAEIAESIAKIKAFQEDKARIEKGKQFRKKISNIKYDISDDAYTIIEKLRERGESVVHDLNNMLSKERVSKREAEHAISDATSSCKDFDTEVIVSLKSALDDEYFCVMTNLRNEYQEYVESVLKENFPQDSELRELQAASMNMPSVRDMIETNTETESREICVGSHEVSTSKWWNPFSWGSSKTVYEYETQVTEFVNLQPIADDITTELRATVMQNIDGFKKQATNNVEMAKTTLLEIMDIIDAKVDEVQAQLLEAQKDKDKKEQIRSENQQKMDWYNDFSNKLQDILAV
jgi:GTPase SAR1 family protein